MTSADNNAGGVAYVRKEEAPVLPPPASQVGVIGWIWRNIFSSMSNFSTVGASVQSITMIVVTTFVLWLGISQIFALLNFMLFSAVWADPDGLKAVACRASNHPDGGIQPEGWFGACYPYVSAKWKLLIYGRYLETELWRPNLIFLIGGLGIGWLIAHVIPNRRIVGVGLLVAGVAIGVIISALFDEGPLGRVGVQLLLGVGFLWLTMPDNAPRGPVGLMMLALYPIISFLLLTGGDLEVSGGTLISLVVVSGALIALGALSARGVLGEIGDAFGGLLRSLGVLIAAAAVTTFLASDILVDMIEASAGNVVSERQAAALDWWAGLEGSSGRLAPTQDEIGAFAESFGSSLTPAELGQLSDMGWTASVWGAASGPGARAAWPMPPVETADWGGLLVTLVVAFAGIVFSFPVGVLLAIGRRSTLPAVRILSISFIEFWRGVPLITVLFMSSVMLPFFLPEDTDFNKLMRALIGVTLFNAAYQAEVVRGGLQAIPKGQYEGAMALGLPYWGMLRLVVLPQALVLTIPGTVNTMISLFKDTTLVLIISLFDLLGMVQVTLRDPEWATPVQATTGYIVAALMFFVFTFSMSRYSMAVERELRRGRSR